MTAQHSDAAATDLPNWYSGERYNEDGDTIWLPVFHKTWIFEGKSVTTMRDAVGERTRGRARAFAASEWGEPFTEVRCRKVWMHLATPDEPGGWTGDMAWECPKDTEGAMPYWRLDWAPPKRCSRCARREKNCAC
jgi:hypothetical protein